MNSKQRKKYKISWNQTFSRNLHHSIEESLRYLSDSIAKDLLLAEVSYLYKNQIHYDIDKYIQEINKIAGEVDIIINKGFKTIEKEINASASIERAAFSKEMEG